MEIDINPTLLKEMSKSDKYAFALKSIKGILLGESNKIANLANSAAILKSIFQWLWVGFYLVEGDELVLGPFQGPVACTRIARGRGVCGQAWDSAKIILVPDVLLFPGHIACSTFSKSEIAIPMILNGQVIGILDIDSEFINDFEDSEIPSLKQIADEITNSLNF